ncbi:transporter substrate-binding domain-containing protein [Lacticaseibacillus nasuensis]|uniref:Amino acid ABC transporter, substrate binding protein n=1 Tax=Lacticaseibacillus nasuensis JCM 17158 TaxID=1291734 RepID=A0A0R1JTA7_9LACO|nr:transporter substrate-binding domain-containing protein [Lacticaseibacillus nasuensis]KRK70954.1 amino acid ABC transporter, substrate binding protein [Lacticaseibacillus nasuensis JCM 17158]
MKKFAIAFVSLVLVGVLAACGQSSKTSKTDSINSELSTKGTLTIGLEGTYQPYSYHNDGKLTGYEVELGRAIAKEMKLKPKFVETKWDSLIAGIDVNKYDVILNNVAKTPERAAKYRFTTAYTSGKSQLAVLKTNKTIKSIKDIKGKKMAQSVTSNNAANVKKLGGTIVPVDGFAQSISLIEQGRADGTVNDAASFYSYLQQKPDAPIKLIAVGNAITPTPARGLLRKDDTALQQGVDKALAKLRADGTLSKLSKQFFGGDVTK